MMDLYLPEGTTLYFVQLIEQAKQARWPLTTCSFMVSPLIPSAPLNISVCQFRVGRMPAAFMLKTLRGVPYSERPLTAGLVAAIWLSRSVVLYTRSMLGTLTLPVPRTAMAFRFLEPITAP